MTEFLRVSCARCGSVVTIDPHGQWDGLCDPCEDELAAQYGDPGDVIESLPRHGSGECS